MNNPLLSEIYERVWRPAFTRLFSLGGSSTEEIDRALVAYLSRPGERSILDVACGPGNYTRRLSTGLTGDGRCIGVDFSPAMLAKAASTNQSARAAYVRGDAHSVPFGDNTFDSVICLAALYLIPDPLPVIDELVRVTKGGGEIAVFTSVQTDLSSLPGVRRVAAQTGYRIFGRTEIIDRFRAAGAVDVEQTITGQGQYVLARKPSGDG